MIKRLVCLLVGLTWLCAGAAQAAKTIYLTYTDAQGTVVAETDVEGNIVARYDYRPYGAPVSGALPEGPGYTGHVNDADSGLVYMQQRYYDPVIGRFLSVDPVTVDGNTGGDFNRYWYANNNPYRFTDPDGRYSCSSGKQFCAKVDGYITALKQSREKLRSSPKTRSEFRLVQRALKEIGEKGKGGPNYVPGKIDGRPSAHTDQKGTTTIDTAKLDAYGSTAAHVGAQAIAHEARHDIDVREGGVKTTEAAVREAEENAYDTSRAVDKGFGLNWTRQQYTDAVEASVQSWLDQQGN